MVAETGKRQQQQKREGGKGVGEERV